MIEFALHHLAIEQRDVPHEAGRDADLREHLGGVEELALGLGHGGLPRELHRAVGRQEAREIIARAVGPRGAGELELGVRGQPLEDERLERARRDAEVHDVPRFGVLHRGVEFERERVVAGLVENDDEAALVGGEMPVGMLREFGEREAAGEDGDRAAARIEHAGGGGEDKCGVGLGERAGELEIAEHDLARLGIGDGDLERDRVGGAVELVGERLRVLGLEAGAHGLGEELCLDGQKTGEGVGLEIELGDGLDLHETAEEHGLRRRERERDERGLPRLEVALDEDGDREFRGWRIGHDGVVDAGLGGDGCGFLRAQEEGASAAGFLADTPVQQRIAGDLLDLALAGDGERDFLGIALEDVDREGEGVGELVTRGLDRLLERGGEKEFVLRGGAPVELALDGDAHLAIGDPAGDGGVFDFRGGGIGVGEASDEEEEDEEGEEEGEGEGARVHG